MAGDEDDFGSVIFPRGKAPAPNPEAPRRLPQETLHPGARKPVVPQPPPAAPVAPPAPPAARTAPPTLVLPAVPPPPAVAVPPASETTDSAEPPAPLLPDPVGPSGLALVKAARAVDVCEPIPLGPDALKLLKQDQTPWQLLQALVSAELFADAIRFLAYILPKREAVWWAHQCVQTLDRKASALALQAVEQWVIAPDEEIRRAAQSAAQKAGPTTPSGMSALAVFWTGGSIGPPDARPGSARTYPIGSRRGLGCHLRGAG